MTANPSNLSLAGKAAVVTGASGPLGRRLAAALAAAGARTLIVARREEPLRQAVQEIAANGGPSLEFLSADAATDRGAQAIARETLRRFGQIDILVNGAAQTSGKTIEQMSLDDWEATLRASLSSAFLCAKHCGEAMKARGGSIVNIGSIYGLVSPDPRVYPEGMAGSSADYAAAKAGLLGLTRHLAVHWAKHNIRCNALVVGGVESERNANPAFRAAYAQRAPLQRMARADDAAGALVFLASGASSYVTGQSIVVDGGWTAW